MNQNLQMFKNPLWLFLLWWSCSFQQPFVKKTFPGIIIASEQFRELLPINVSLNRCNTTDFNGNHSIKLAPEIILTKCYLGDQTWKFIVNGQIGIDIPLEGVAGLHEVMVKVHTRDEEKSIPQSVFNISSSEDIQIVHRGSTVSAPVVSGVLSFQV